MPDTTVTRQDHTFVDSFGVTIHYYVWRPEHARAVVQLAHGLGEYATRYEPFIRELNAAGYAVYADDHRGHGATGLEQVGGDHKKLGRLGEGGVRAQVADAQPAQPVRRAAHLQRSGLHEIQQHADRPSSRRTAAQEEYHQRE